jgi:anti-sigma B factor antagonist
MTGDVGETLRLETAERDGCAVLTASGTIDYLSAEKLRVGIRQVTAPCVVLNLAAVTFLDSTALAVLIASDEFTRGRGARLRLAAPREQLIRLLQTTNLDRILEVYDDVTAAVTSRTE